MKLTVNIDEIDYNVLMTALSITRLNKENLHPEVAFRATDLMRIFRNAKRVAEESPTEDLGVR